MIRYPRILISSFDLLAFSCLLCLFLFCVYCSSLFPHSKLLVFVSSLLFPHFCLGGPCLLTVSTPSPTTHPPLHLALQRWVRSCCLSRLPRPLNAPAAVKLSLGEDLGPGGDVRTPPNPPHALLNSAPPHTPSTPSGRDGSRVTLVWSIVGQTQRRRDAIVAGWSSQGGKIGRRGVAASPVLLFVTMAALCFYFLWFLFSAVIGRWERARRRPIQPHSLCLQYAAIQ